jgi:hypothetical protein
MRSATAVLVLLVAALGASSCHSLTRIRRSHEVRCAGAATLLEVWVDAPGPILRSPPNAVYDTVVPVLLYPLDKLSSLIVAVRAPFDPDIDLQWGPFGAVAGITLPWVTLMPFVYPPFEWATVELEPAAYADLLSRIDAGDGAAAYLEHVGERHLMDGANSVHAVSRLAGELPATELRKTRPSRAERP